MKTITINDGTVSEVLHLLPYFSAAAAEELRSQLAPAVVAAILQPPGDIQGIGRTAGFDRVLVRPWDWAAEQKITIDTSSYGGIGVNGILVIPFVPTWPADINNIATMSATGYPSPNMGNALTLCVSDSPCSLYAPEPASATDTSPTVSYGVGTVSHYWATGKASAAELIPGKQYYINVAGRNQVSESQPYGVSTVRGDLMYYPHCDFRVEAQKPDGH